MLQASRGIAMLFFVAVIAVVGFAVSRTHVGGWADLTASISLFGQLSANSSSSSTTTIDDLHSGASVSSSHSAEVHHHCNISALPSFIQFTRLSPSRWAWRTSPQRWCPAVALPLTSDALQTQLSGKRILFLGDSVARNSFVLTMSRLCNENNFDKCITRMPTYEYDVTTAEPSNRGPLGCVPGVDKSVASNATSACYQHGDFRDIPLARLTTRYVPRDRAKRRIFINKQLIGPALQMVFSNVTLIYLPVSKPQQIVRTAVWMMGSRQRGRGGYLHTDAIVVAIGAHLKFAEVEAAPKILAGALSLLRNATSAPIFLAEFPQALRSPPQYVHFVDSLMSKLRNKLAADDIVVVPQRFVTRDGFLLHTGNATLADKEIAERGNASASNWSCGYYDPQHPALRCQFLTSELLLAAVLSRVGQHQPAKAPEQTERRSTAPTGVTTGDNSNSSSRSSEAGGQAHDLDLKTTANASSGSSSSSSVDPQLPVNESTTTTTSG